MRFSTTLLAVLLASFSLCQTETLAAPPAKSTAKAPVAKRAPVKSGKVAPAAAGHAGPSGATTAVYNNY